MRCLSAQLVAHHQDQAALRQSQEFAAAKATGFGEGCHLTGILQALQSCPVVSLVVALRRSILEQGLQ